ncbi:MAG: hypothetical protein NWQ46_07395 [Spirosomaceae bacterium]|nr:hypothetical protein [Spirosomataceae bacterium]
MSSKQLVVLLLVIFCTLSSTLSVSAASFSKYAPKLLRFEGAGYGIHKPIYGDRDFTKTEALRIMRKNYWDRFHGNRFASQEVAEVLIDHLINAGSGRNGENIKAFEAIIGVPQDGHLSIEDVDRANSFYFADQIVNPYVKYRILYYKSRPDANLYPGWITRATSFLISPVDSKINVKALYLPPVIERRFKHIKL